MPASKQEEVVAVLNRLLEAELAGVVRYTHYSFLVFGFGRIPIVSWLREQASLEVEPEELTDLDYEDARKVVWNAYDARYRPEMRRMERRLLLSHLDSSWKNHLYVMDHLRQSIGLRGYAQEDPKTVYKQEGMKEFDGMWQGTRDKVGETMSGDEVAVDHRTGPVERAGNEAQAPLHLQLRQGRRQVRGCRWRAEA